MADKMENILEAMGRPQDEGKIRGIQLSKPGTLVTKSSKRSRSKDDPVSAFPGFHTKKAPYVPVTSWQSLVWSGGLDRLI